jgi:HSP20 family protein
MTEKEKKELEVSKKKEIEKSGGELTREGVWFVPSVDIIESPDAITLYADLPGTRKEDVDIDVREGVLTLTAAVDPAEKNHDSVYREYEIGGYNRSFTLGERIDPDKINAKMQDGVLTLVLPKSEAHKPRKVEIK